MKRDQLDTRRLLCPLPVIKTQDKIKKMHTGDQLEVVGTDPGIMEDIPAWCRINSHNVLAKSSQDGEYTILIEVGG